MESHIKPALPNNLPLYFLGDHHGVWSNVFSKITKHTLENCILFSVGDVGIGFQSRSAEIEHTKKLNHLFSEKNIHFLAIRGNHDDPSYFNGPNRINLSNFQLLPDYTLLSHNGLTLLGIGGATSIDRCERWPGTSYWFDEGILVQSHLLQKADILATHTAPLQCFPQGHNQIVHHWAQKDPQLLEDLRTERHILQEMFEKIQPQHHFYGHFHDSHRETIGGCHHVLLNIYELHPSPSNP